MDVLDDEYWCDEDQVQLGEVLTYLFRLCFNQCNASLHFGSSKHSFSNFITLPTHYLLLFQLNFSVSIIVSTVRLSIPSTFEVDSIRINSVIFERLPHHFGSCCLLPLYFHMRS